MRAVNWVVGWNFGGIEIKNMVSKWNESIKVVQLYEKYLSFIF